MVDLGGNQEVVWAQLERHHRAMAAGVTVIPDCAQVTGTGINLMAHVAHRLDPADSVVLYDGGLPQHPWNYRLTFNIDGLTNE
jgi:saccharopine dehydrogenase-like NADP-dependent oxidoreductase